MITFFKKLIFIYLFIVRESEGVYAMVHMWKAEDNLGESILPFNYVVLSQVVRLHRKGLCLLNHQLAPFKEPYLSVHPKNETTMKDAQIN